VAGNELLACALPPVRTAAVICEVDVHTYEKQFRDVVAPPSLETFRFKCAEDVAAFAAYNPYIGSATWPEVWHLDEQGRFACYYKASSGDSLECWAADPYPLLRSREEGLRSGGCASDWLIVESRPAYRTRRGAVVTEHDTDDFLELQEQLDEVGVRLVDAIIFDDACHWWSMRELTTGSTHW
jgi:hypothetical protein